MFNDSTMTAQWGLPDFGDHYVQALGLYEQALAGASLNAFEEYVQRELATDLAMLPLLEILSEEIRRRQRTLNAEGALLTDAALSLLDDWLKGLLVLSLRQQLVLNAWDAPAPDGDHRLH